MAILLVVGFRLMTKHLPTTKWGLN